MQCNVDFTTNIFNLSIFSILQPHSFEKTPSYSCLVMSLVIVEPWSPGFVLSLPLKDGFLKIIQVTIKHDPIDAM